MLLPQETRKENKTEGRISRRAEISKIENKKTMINETIG